MERKPRLVRQNAQAVIEIRSSRHHHAQRPPRIIIQVGPSSSSSSSSSSFASLPPFLSLSQSQGEALVPAAEPVTVPMRRAEKRSAPAAEEAPPPQTTGRDRHGRFQRPKRQRRAPSPEPEALPAPEPDPTPAPAPAAAPAPASLPRLPSFLGGPSSLDWRASQDGAQLPPSLSWGELLNNPSWS